MASPRLDQSRALTLEALGKLVEQRVIELRIDGRKVAVSRSTPPSDARHPFILQWEGGSARVHLEFSDSAPPGPAEKRGDKGHLLGLAVRSRQRDRMLAWSSFEWNIRDAIRSGSGRADLDFFHMYVTQDGSEVNRANAERSRAIAARSGLSGDATLILGTYDVPRKTWDAPDVLAKVLTLGLIKAHFMDDGQGRYISGSPLFLAGAMIAEDGDVDKPVPEDIKVAAAIEPPRERPPYRTIDPAAVQVDDDLVFSADLIARCAAALNAGKHLLLVGPPGTGKSRLALALANHAHRLGICDDKPKLATASADWTTYDTIGGWMQHRDQTLHFREGAFADALKQGRWLILDEINRADVDKCFGELMTVLAGSGTVETIYKVDYRGREISVNFGPREEPYNFGPWFRLIATMNLRDKASLFRLSYAFMRRFAVVHVPILGDADLRKLAEKQEKDHGVPEAIWSFAHTCLSQKEGLGKHVELGPSLLRDVIAYAHQRGGPPRRAVGEGLGQLVFPQLEGLGEAAAQDTEGQLLALFADDHALRDELRRELRSYFPHLGARR